VLPCTLLYIVLDPCWPLHLLSRFTKPNTPCICFSISFHPLPYTSNISPSPSPHPTNSPTVVWKVTPLFATWLLLPTNPLSTLFTPSTTVLELGSGVSGIVALALGPRIARYTATDQPYVLKLLRQNITANIETVFPRPRKGGKKLNTDGRILTASLDWETDSVANVDPVDVVIACDCIYNDALIEPLNSTCAALCRRAADPAKPTLCVVAQQLRSPEVFEAWLKSFCDKFEVWQVPGEMLGEGLSEGSGFVVHVGLVR
jgi:hypothetical protein